MTALQQQNIVVVGLGVTGTSVVRFLLSHGCQPTLVDSRPQPPLAEDLAQQLSSLPHCFGELPLELLLAADLLIVSPGVPLSTPELQIAIDAEVEVIGDIELFARFAQAPVLAITGSNGKSTVTTLLGEMAEAAGIKVAVGGNIGTPALDLLAQQPELYVLELSSFQLETTHSLKCRAATVLNLSPDHMDRYASLYAYQQAKLKIYSGCDVLVFNRDDPMTRPEHVDAQQSLISFGREPQAEASAYALMRDNKQIWLTRGSHKLLQTSELPLVGEHNQLNALAALALGEAAGISRDSMLATLRQFHGLKHRCQRVADKNGVIFVNDSKATNVGATVAALEGLAEHPGQIHLIAGGDGKGADFSPLQPLFTSRVDSLITLGVDGEALAALKPGAQQVDTLEQAVELAATNAKSGDLVLLSPACASLDMFRNFEQRGDRFIQAVEALPC